MLICISTLVQRTVAGHTNICVVFFRGEKLYVTKDKRRTTTWRRCIVWAVACTVVAVVIILAILAGSK